MVRTLYAKLALGLFGLLVAVGLLYVVISTAAFREHQEAAIQQLNHGLARALVFDRNLVEEGQLNEQALKETFELYMTIHPGIEIYLLDAQGRILSYSADPQKIKRERVALGPIRRMLGDSPAYPIPGDDPRDHDERKVFSVAPLPSGDDVQGYLYVVLRGEAYEAAQRMARGGHFFALSAWAVSISLAFGLVAGLVLFRLMTRRLEALSSLVQQFEAREGGEALPYQPQSHQHPDEIDRLGLTFDHMSARIARQIEQLREQDAMRRRLVATVSHDLRTPLTSMRGFLESLQIKGDSLTDAERREFLRIALAQGERLSRLVAELFEFAALDARERQAQLEPFAPADLIHDVARKHQPAANAGDVRIEVDLPRETPFAHGDLAMIERVLDNLIDNAITHTPSGGTVRLRAWTEDQELRIAVADDGPGISEEAREHLFEPFTRGDEREAAGHAGLGLAIARRMMELQGGALELGDPGTRGAEFIVTLPLAPATPGAVRKS